MANPIKTGLASFGMSGYVFHAPLLHVNEGFAITTIVERNNSNSTEKYPYAKIVRSFDELCQEEDLELIIVNVPDPLHFEYSKKALNAGKHVVVEKPFTQNSEQADELIKIAKENGLILSVFQNRRWDSDFLTIQNLIKDNAFGKLVDYEAHFDRYKNVIQEDSWKETAKAGAGIVFNLGSHLIDQSMVLFGMPESVYATIRKVRPNTAVNDSFTIILTYPQIKVTLKASYLVREPGPRYLIHGTEGSFLKWGIDPQEQDLKDGYLPMDEDWGEEDTDAAGILNTNFGENHFEGELESINGNYPAFYANIFEAIRNDAELAVKPGEAANVIRIIEAAFLSVEEERVIKL